MSTDINITLQTGHVVTSVADLADALAEVHQTLLDADPVPEAVADDLTADEVREAVRQVWTDRKAKGRRYLRPRKRLTGDPSSIAEAYHTWLRWHQSSGDITSLVFAQVRCGQEAFDQGDYLADLTRAVAGKGTSHAVEAWQRALGKVAS